MDTFNKCGRFWVENPPPMVYRKQRQFLFYAEDAEHAERSGMVPVLFSTIYETICLVNKVRFLGSSFNENIEMR